jgi:hypothetical protein
VQHASAGPAIGADAPGATRRRNAMGAAAARTTAAKSLSAEAGLVRTCSGSSLCFCGSSELNCRLNDQSVAPVAVGRFLRIRGVVLCGTNRPRSWFRRCTRDSCVLVGGRVLVGSKGRGINRGSLAGRRGENGPQDEPGLRLDRDQLSDLAAIPGDGERLAGLQGVQDFSGVGLQILLGDLRRYARGTTVGQSHDPGATWPRPVLVSCGPAG